MKKIVLFGLNGRSGPLHVSSNLANSLSKNYETYIVLPSYSNKNLLNKKVNLITTKAPPSVKHTAILTLKRKMHKNLMKEIEKITPDYVLFMDDHPWYINYAKKLKKHNTKFGFVINDPRFHTGDIGFFEGKYTRWFHKWMYKHSNKVITLSKASKKYLLKDGVKENKIVISKIGFIDLKLKKSKTTKPKKNSILFFGRIVKYKGLDILSEAIKLVSKKISDVKCVVAGSGDINPYIKGFDKKHFQITNKFIHENELIKFFENTELVVLPYIDATQTAVVQIAYYFQKPVIVTNVGALPEVVRAGKTGFIVPRKNPAVLAQKIVEFLKMSEKDKKQMQKNIDEYVSKDLSWDNISKKLIKDLF